MPPLPSDTSGLVLDIETVVDGRLIQRVKWPNEPKLGAQEAVARLRDELLMESGGKVDFIPHVYHVPVSIALVVDNSGSMYRKRPSVNKSALDLIQASNPKDEAFVVNFSDEAFIDQEFTSDVNRLRDGLSHIESRGGTALYDAVAASADKLVADAKRPKQVLILITDGEDNASSLDLEQAIHRVQQLSGPVIYSIGLLFGPEMTRAEVRHARRALEMLAERH